MDSRGSYPSASHEAAGCASQAGAATTGIKVEATRHGWDARAGALTASSNTESFAVLAYAGRTHSLTDGLLRCHRCLQRLSLAQRKCEASIWGAGLC